MGAAYFIGGGKGELTQLSAKCWKTESVACEKIGIISTDLQYINTFD